MTLDQAITVTGQARAKVTRIRIYLQSREGYYDGLHEALQSACVELDLIINHLSLIKKARLTQL